MSDIALRLSGPNGTETRLLDSEEAALICRPTTIELLRAIAKEEPASIRETARIVERDVRQVHDNLWTLGEHGFVEFERTGRSRRPFVSYDEIELEIGL
ncbi:MAG: putative transcriptional regulator [Natronomonas sp.]|jgi:predicted transcriptional regulator|uniref:HVO_A0114 family putative DNA-binding protein n=1 Tax=Natronomonas sp. TaxID=2184060 RepID=UPI00398A32BF